MCEYIDRIGKFLPKEIDDRQRSGVEQHLN